MIIRPKDNEQKMDKKKQKNFSEVVLEHFHTWHKEVIQING